MFKVGVVEPFALGPLSNRHFSIMTTMDKKARPKNLKVSQYGDEPLKIQVQWSPSCPSYGGVVPYIVNTFPYITVFFIKQSIYRLLFMSPLKIICGKSGNRIAAICLICLR